MDNFKTDRTFEDLETDCFITSSEQKQSVNESLERIIRNYITERIDEKFQFETKNEPSKSKSDKKRVSGGIHKESLPEYVLDKHYLLYGAVNALIDSANPGGSFVTLAAATATSRVVEYMKKHNIGDASVI